MLTDYVKAVQDQECKGINSIRISGWITSKYEGRTFVKLTVSVKGRNNKIDYPTVYAFKDKDGTTPVDDYYIKDYISLSGHMSSMPEYKTEGKEPVQQVVMDSVHKPRRTRVGRHMGRYVDANSVYLKGFVTNVEHAQAVSFVTVESISKDGVKNTIRFVDFGNLTKDVETGLEYEIFGYIKTKRKADDAGRRKPVYYQDAVVTRIQKPKKIYEKDRKTEEDQLSQLDALAM